MNLLLLGLFLTLLAAWLFSRVRQMHARAPVLLLLAVYLAPAAFVAVTLYQAQEDVRLRFALLGLGFRSSDGGAFEIEVGGDRKAHDFWVAAFDDGRGEAMRSTEQSNTRSKNLHLGTLLVQPATASTAEGPAVLQLRPTEWDPPGIFGQRLHGTLQPVQSVELFTGDRIAIAGSAWTVELGSLLTAPARFTDDQGRRIELPRRQGKLPFLRISYPILRAAPPTLATYPLAWLTRDENGSFPTPRPHGFFYLLPKGLSYGLHLTTTDPQVVVTRNDQPLAVGAEFTLTPGQRIHTLSWPRWSEDEFLASGIRDRRSARVLPGQRSAVLAYDTPEVYVLPWSTLTELASRVGDGSGEEKSLRVHLSMGGWQLMDRSLYFRHTSLPVALEALAILEFPVTAQGSLQPTSELAATTPRGQRRSAFGHPIWLGQNHLASIQIDRLAPSLLLALLAIVLALTKCSAARAAELTTGHALLLAAVEPLLALRLLLGFQAWALPPFEEEAYQLALIAWMSLPWIFLTAALPTRRDLPLGRFLPVAAGWLVSLLWCFRLSGSGGQMVAWMGLHLLAIAVPVLRRSTLPERFARRLEGFFDAPRSRRRTLLLWSLVACAPGALRVLLLFVGFRESLPLGPRFALTLLHIPSALVLEALYLVWLWRRMNQRGRLEAGDLLPAWAFVLGSWLVPALAVSDLGLALLNVPVFLLAASGVCLAGARKLRAGRPWQKGSWQYQLPALALALTLLFIAIPAGARLAIQTVTAVLPASWSEMLQSERNFLRLLDFAYPNQLEEVARQNSEELAVMSTVLRTYTSIGFTGRGYLQTEISPHIQATALREHVPAIFLAAQWGTAGILGVVLLWLLALAAGFAHTPGHLPDTQFDPDLEEGGIWGTLGGLAALTFAIPSLYMILANYRLVLFTGKNAYLLGLDSTADVVESAILLLFFAWGAAALRDRGTN